MSSWIHGYNYTEGNRAVAARERFSLPSAVYDLFEVFRRADQQDADRRAKIRAINNGFLPYDPAELQRAGQAWRTNINFRTLSNAIDARAEAVNRLSTDNINLVTLDSPVPVAAGPDDEAFNAIVAEEFSRAVRRDGRVIPQFVRQNKEADLYGIGPMTWRDDEDYVPCALERGQVFFDPLGSVLSSEHEVIFVDSTMPATTLFRLLDNPEVSEEAGWNMAAVKRWTVEVFHNDVDIRSAHSADGGISIVESEIERIRRNDFYEPHQFDRFHVLHVYVREMRMPRGITHIIVPASNQNQSQSVEREFLFKRENAYETMDDAFFWFVPDNSVRYAKSARGIASVIAPMAATQDRLGCAMVDSSIRAMSMVVQQKNPGASPVMTLQELGPYTVVGADLNPVPNANQMSNFQGVLQVQQMLEAKSTGSLAGTAFGITTPKLQTGGQGVSKAEAEIMERKQTARDENFTASRIAAWRIGVRGTFNRFMRIATGPKVILDEYPYVAEFVERCGKRGVSVAAMKEMMKTMTVDVNRDLVVGVEGIVQFVGAALAQFGGNADEAGRKRMSHDIVRYQLGKASADRYFPVESRDNGPSNDASVATLENNAIQAGQPVLVGPDQRQLAHINVHMQVVQQIQQAVQQGLAEAQKEYQQNGQMQQDADGNLAPKVENPEQLMQVLVAVSEHIRAHNQIFALQPNAKDQAKRVEKTLAGLGNVTQALNLAIATQRRVREAEEKKRRLELEQLQKAADEAEIAKANHKADLDAQNARHKIDLDHQVALEKLRMEGEQGQARLRMEGEQLRGRSRLDYESARNKAIIDSEAARSDMARKNAESRNAMQISQRTAENEARLKAGEAAADRMASRERLNQVTGRQSPQPAEFTQGAAGGMIPL